MLGATNLECAYVTCRGDEKAIWVSLGLGGVLRTQALVSVSKYFVRIMIFDKCILVTLV